MRYLIILLLLAGCVSSQGVIDDTISQSIPNNAELVIATTDMTHANLLDIARKSLIREGHRVDADSESLILSTEGLDVGQSTLARYTIYIEDSEIYGRADWSIGATASVMVTGSAAESGWERARWSSGRPMRAFASLAAFMNEIPHDNIRYE